MTSKVYPALPSSHTELLDFHLPMPNHPNSSRNRHKTIARRSLVDKALSSTLRPSRTITPRTPKTSTTARLTALVTRFLSPSSSIPLCSKVLLDLSPRHLQRQNRRLPQSRHNHRTVKASMDNNIHRAPTATSTINTDMDKALIACHPMITGNNFTEEAARRCRASWVLYRQPDQPLDHLSVSVLEAPQRLRTSLTART